MASALPPTWINISPRLLGPERDCVSSALSDIWRAGGKPVGRDPPHSLGETVGDRSSPVWWSPLTFSPPLMLLIIISTRPLFMIILSLASYSIKLECFDICLFYVLTVYCAYLIFPILLAKPRFPSSVSIHPPIRLVSKIGEPCGLPCALLMSQMRKLVSHPNPH